jgi:thiamine-phosphate pyrophosphorylase
VISERGAIFRILDANFNRLREALRVIEESERFFHENIKNSSVLKQLRDLCRDAYCDLPQDELLANRESANDLGRTSAGVGEMERAGISEIVVANFKRAQEASRVIEEYAKTINVAVSKKAKEIRFCLYDIEKNMFYKCVSPTKSVEYNKPNEPDEPVETGFKPVSTGSSGLRGNVITNKKG